jgi:hypothetical protein
MATPRLGNVWAVGAKLYNKQGKLIGTCLDTPNAIAKAMMEHPSIARVSSILGNGSRKDYAKRMGSFNTATSMFTKV